MITERWHRSEGFPKSFTSQNQEISVIFWGTSDRNSRPNRGWKAANEDKTRTSKGQSLKRDVIENEYQAYQKEVMDQVEFCCLMKNSRGLLGDMLAPWRSAVDSEGCRRIHISHATKCNLAQSGDVIDDRVPAAPASKPVWDCGSSLHYAKHDTAYRLPDTPTGAFHVRLGTGIKKPELHKCKRLNLYVIILNFW